MIQKVNRRVFGVVESQPKFVDLSMIRLQILQNITPKPQDAGVQTGMPASGYKRQPKFPNSVTVFFFSVSGPVISPQIQGVIPLEGQITSPGGGGGSD